MQSRTCHKKTCNVPPLSPRFKSNISTMHNTPTVTESQNHSNPNPTKSRRTRSIPMITRTPEHHSKTRAINPSLQPSQQDPWRPETFHIHTQPTRQGVQTPCMLGPCGTVKASSSVFTVNSNPDIYIYIYSRPASTFELTDHLGRMRCELRPAVS